MTKETIKEIILKNTPFNNNIESIKENLSYYLFDDLEKEIEIKNAWRPKEEQEKAKEEELLNCGLGNYYKQIKSIELFENTSENRKKLFDYESLLNFIDNNKTLNNYKDWYIKYDMKNKKVLDITPLSCITWHFHDKEVKNFILKNPQYLKNYNIYNIIIKLDEIIKECLNELQNNYIYTKCKLYNLDAFKKVTFLKYLDSKEEYQKILSVFDEEGKAFYINDIEICENKSVPILANAKTNNFNNIENDFIKNNFKINIYDHHDFINLQLLGSCIGLDVYKKFFILRYNSNHYWFYKIDKKFYEYEKYKNCYNNNVYYFNIFKVIKGSKTRSIILKAISILED